MLYKLFSKCFDGFIWPSVWIKVAINPIPETILLGGQ